MFYQWEKFEKELDTLLKEKQRYKEDDFMHQQLKIRVENYWFLDKRIKQVFRLLKKNFDIDKKTLKNILLPNSKLFDLSNKEIITRFNYYLNLFGNKELLCKVIKNETEFFEGDQIFRWENMYNAESELKKLQKIFNIDQDRARLMAINNTYFFIKEQKELEQKIQRYAMILNTDESNIKNMCLIYPSSFGNTTKRLLEKIEGFSTIFKIDKETTKKIFLKFPLLTTYAKVTFINCVRILKNFISDIPSFIVKYPLIINLLNYNEKTFLGDFIKFEQLIENLEYIKQNIGEIIYIFTCKYKKYISFCIVVTKNNEILCIIFGLESGKFEVGTFKNYYTYKNWILPYFIFHSYEENYIFTNLKTILKNIFNIEIKEINIEYFINNGKMLT